MEKKGKNEIGTEGWHGVKKNPTQIWTYLCEILLNSFPTELASDTQPLRLIKMIYNTKTWRSWNKQSESVNVRP